MTSKAHRIEIGVLCSAIILLSLWGIVWDISSGLLTSGIDGIMLLLIALMIGGIFSLMFAHMLWQEGLLPFFKPAPVAAAPAKAATTTPAAKPAAAAPGAAPPKPPAASTAVPANAPASPQAAPAPKPAAAAPSSAPPEPTTK